MKTIINVILFAVLLAGCDPFYSDGLTQYRIEHNSYLNEYRITKKIEAYGYYKSYWKDIGKFTNIDEARVFIEKKRAEEKEHSRLHKLKTTWEVVK